MITGCAMHPAKSENEARSVGHRPHRGFPVSAGLMRCQFITRCRSAVTRAGLFVGCVTISSVCSAGIDTQAPDDMVSFFKNALSSPPDVEQFIGRIRSLEQLGPTAGLPKGRHLQPLQFFEGGRAGSNFFLRSVPDPDLPAKPPPVAIVSGRAGSNVYQIGRNDVTYGIGTNSVVAANGAFFGLACQFLNMGLSDVRPETVVWSSNQFRALKFDGTPMSGELEISNKLPYRLSIRFGNPPARLKAYQYSYPDPVGQLAGFPSTITILASSERGFKSTHEMELLAVHVAPRRLRDNFFNDSKFKTASVVTTNIFSNADLYITRSDGQIVKSPVPLSVAAGYGKSHKRVVAWICFAVLALVPPVIIWLGAIRSANTKKTKTKLK